MAKGQNVVYLICPCLQGSNCLLSSRKQSKTNRNVSLSWAHMTGVYRGDPEFGIIWPPSCWILFLRTRKLSWSTSPGRQSMWGRGGGWVRWRLAAASSVNNTDQNYVPKWNQYWTKWTSRDQSWSSRIKEQLGQMGRCWKVQCKLLGCRRYENTSHEAAPWGCYSSLTGLESLQYWRKALENMTLPPPHRNLEGWLEPLACNLFLF